MRTHAIVDRDAGLDSRRDSAKQSTLQRRVDIVLRRPRFSSRGLVGPSVGRRRWHRGVPAADCRPLVSRLTKQ